MALLDRAIVRTLPAVPKPIVRRISARYIAGTHVEDALRVVERLNAERKTATIDVLGEEITTWEEARHIGYEYENVFRVIDEQGLDSNVSIKLTALGLKLDYGLCREVVERLVREAGQRGNFVRIDMEDSSCTDDTLRLYRELREAGLDNVGVVFQAYLRRTLVDIEALSDLTPNVRLCKGIYVEPEEIAYRGYDEVREGFVRALDALLAGGSYVGIATHDEWLLGEGVRLVSEQGRSPAEYEFQMLLGVRQERATQLVQEGHRVRIYVPYGEQWYAYSLRRLQENPKLAGYIAGDTLRRFIPGRNGR
ncbi:MAG TPA: proline dehydrogenase family protein [Gaiellaceae bacterium]|nr:proline dehydrogenase family protein [Gaiellaceae bacterium]